MASRKSRQDKPGSKKPKADLDRRAGVRDWETLLGLSAQALASVLASSPEDEALDRAQELVFDAWEARSKKKRIALARQALAVSPNCADAYVLLAEYADTDSNEALDLYKRAVEAGEKALDKDVFEEEAGHFWGLLATRPYMRARFALARALWGRCRRDEAIAHLQDMLRLNPNDNQGVRYILAGYLLEADRDSDLAALLKKYKVDSSAWWVYSHVLLAFRTRGPGSAATRYFARAIAANPHVPAYLLAMKKMPARLPEFYSPGAEDEAIYYVTEGLSAWRRTEGALDWLRQQLSGR